MVLDDFPERSPDGSFSISYRNFSTPTDKTTYDRTNFSNWHYFATWQKFRFHNATRKFQPHRKSIVVMGIFRVFRLFRLFWLFWLFRLYLSKFFRISVNRFIDNCFNKHEVHSHLSISLARISLDRKWKGPSSDKDSAISTQSTANFCH